MARARRPIAGVFSTAVAGALFLALGGEAALAELQPPGVRSARWNSDLLARAALVQVHNGGQAEGRATALAALRLMPINQLALGIVSATGDQVQRVGALNQAAALGWRDPLTNLRLLTVALQKGDADVAAQRIDAWSRIHGPEHSAAWADQLLTMQGGVAALAARAQVRFGTGWIPAYLATPPSSVASARARAALVAAIDDDDGAWKRQVVAHAILGFGRGGLSQESYPLWRNTIARRARWSGAIYDPALREIRPVAEAIGGEWRANNQGGTTVDSLPDGGARIDLPAGYLGEVISQPLRPRSGPLSLRITWEHAVDLAKDSAWTLTCPPGRAAPMQRTVHKVGSGWQEHLAVAAPGCVEPVLALVSKVPSEKERSWVLRSVEMQ